MSYEQNLQMHMYNIRIINYIWKSSLHQNQL